MKARRKISPSSASVCTMRRRCARSISSSRVEPRARALTRLCRPEIMSTSPVNSPCLVHRDVLVAGPGRGVDLHASGQEHVERALGRAPLVDRLPAPNRRSRPNGRRRSQLEKDTAASIAALQTILKAGGFFTGPDRRRVVAGARGRGEGVPEGGRAPRDRRPSTSRRSPRCSLAVEQVTSPSTTTEVSTTTTEASSGSTTTEAETTTEPPATTAAATTTAPTTTTAG